MKIGIDGTVLQSGHRMRGIGATLINFINNLPEDAKTNHTFILYLYDDAESPLDLINLNGIEYSTKYIDRPKQSSINLPRRLNAINRLINFLHKKRDILFGDSRIKNLKELDWFIQFDQNQPLPARHKVSSTLILYDLIPYVMENEYLYSYKTARKRGHSRKGALLHHVVRRSYAKKIRKIAKRAIRLIAISKYTKKDFVKYLDIKPQNITVVHLGINQLDNKSNLEDEPSFQRYIATSWGYLPEAVSIESQKYLLFVGGADPRRKLVDLVGAFNNLRAQGHDIKLVLAGDTMLGAFKVPHAELQKYLKHTSYLEDIYFLGFVDEIQRDWLYKNAIAFVYPSVYEGFGLPILEAMQYGTPVITYDNSSIKEVAGNAAMYASDYMDIIRHVKIIISDSKVRHKYGALGQRQASKFTWSNTSSDILKSIA
jgi:glycosyltransferase involved in cell wall biosynthesis